MNNTALVWDPLFIRHLEGYDHPERPERLIQIYEQLKTQGLDKSTQHIPIRLAEEDEIKLVHAPQHYDLIKRTENTSHAVHLDPDTASTEKSFEAAMSAVGGCLNLVDAIWRGEADNGFALVRPPGHHARPNQTMGFCLFNNIAIAAAHLLENHGLERIAIVDFDVHHGNGTQDAFNDSNQILYMSTHQSPFYPGTGRYSEIGHKEGKGKTVNVPLPWGCGEAEYIPIYRDFFVPILESFDPQFILVSAGYDIHSGDIIGGMQLSSEGIGLIVDILANAADQLCDGKIALFLEGGYNVDAEADSVVRSIKSLQGYRNGDALNQFTFDSGEAPSLVYNTYNTVIEYWPELKNSAAGAVCEKQ